MSDEKISCAPPPRLKEDTILREDQLKLSIAGLSRVGNVEAQPFIKWVGGKGQLLTQFDEFLPTDIQRYYEPFVGGGALFFHLKKRFPYLHAFLRDNNPELVNAYQVVRDFPRQLMQRLDAHLTRYRSDRESYYYLVRSQHQLPPAEVVERAARMIFLNKTCFNGLWRVNARDEFNVPIGSQRNPALYDRANILSASHALRDAHIAVQDFRLTLNQARRGDFVYIDPPYVPLSPTASFTTYTKEDFGLEEQRELAALFGDSARRGVRLMLSNSDTPLVRILYKGFTIHTVRARRPVNRDGSKRGEINEVVITSP